MSLPNKKRKNNTKGETIVLLQEELPNAKDIEEMILENDEKNWKHSPKKTEVPTHDSKSTIQRHEYKSTEKSTH